MKSFTLRQKYFGFCIPKLGTPHLVLISTVYCLSNTYVHILENCIALLHDLQGRRRREGQMPPPKKTKEQKQEYTIIEVFIPFSFFVGFGRQRYENVYLHFLKVWPVLPCKWKPSPKTEVRRLFSKFFTADILFWEHLGVVCFRLKNQHFL